MYLINDYSYKQAKKLGVIIKPSTNLKKKIDVIKNNKVISIGATGYKDYPTYLKIGKKLANERRRLYKIRHAKDKSQVGTAGYYANKILW